MEASIKSIKEQKAVYHILRLGVAMCFIGHGAFGIITKPVWCNYFGVFGIGHDLAYQLMPVIGSVDILLGFVMLIYPIRAVPAWLVFWGLLTASLRPFSGEPFVEFIERAGNFGAPFMLLSIVGFDWRNAKNWFTRISPDIECDQRTWQQLSTKLQIVAFLLLVGHGCLFIIHKKGLIDQLYGFHFQSTTSMAFILGWFEIGIAFLILVKPIRPFILAIFIWKMASELFYPHYELFEWIERGGSYTVLLALWLIMKTSFKLVFSREKEFVKLTQ